MNSMTRKALTSLVFVLASAVLGTAAFAGILKHPYLIYPDVTATAVLTNASMLSALLVVLGLGLVVVVPSLVYLNVLFRSEKSY